MKFRVRLNKFETRNLTFKNRSDSLPKPYIKVNFDHGYKRSKTHIDSAQFCSSNLVVFDYDLEFFYECEYHNNLHRKFLNISLWEKSGLLSDHEIGEINIDLLTLAAGPIAHELTLYSIADAIHPKNPAGIIKFECEMEQISLLTVAFNSVSVTNLPLVNGEKPNTYLTYQYTATNHELVGKSLRIMNNCNPDFTKLDHYKFPATLKDLFKNSMLITVWIKANKQATSEKFGSVLLPFKKFHCFKDEQALSTSLPIQVTPDFEPNYSSAMHISMFYVSLPAFAQMITGIHTDKGIENGQVFCEGVILPQLNLTTASDINYAAEEEKRAEPTPSQAAENSVNSTSRRSSTNPPLPPRISIEAKNHLFNNVLSATPNSASRSIQSQQNNLNPNNQYIAGQSPSSATSLLSERPQFQFLPNSNLHRRVGSNSEMSDPVALPSASQISPENNSAIATTDDTSSESTPRRNSRYLTTTHEISEALGALRREMAEQNNKSSAAENNNPSNDSNQQNEIGAGPEPGEFVKILPGPAGFCIVCSKPAANRCKQTKAPVCSFECKIKHLEINNIPPSNSGPPPPPPRPARKPSIIAFQSQLAGEEIPSAPAVPPRPRARAGSFSVPAAAARSSLSQSQPIVFPADMKQLEVAKPGKAGFCVVCDRPADCICAQTQVPVCGVACKQKHLQLNPHLLHDPAPPSVVQTSQQAEPTSQPLPTVNSVVIDRARTPTPPEWPARPVVISPVLVTPINQFTELKLNNPPVQREQKEESKQNLLGLPAINTHNRMPLAGFAQSAVNNPHSGGSSSVSSAITSPSSAPAISPELNQMINAGLRVPRPMDREHRIGKPKKKLLPAVDIVQAPMHRRAKAASNGMHRSTSSHSLNKLDQSVCEPSVRFSESCYVEEMLYEEQQPLRKKVLPLQKHKRSLSNPLNISALALQNNQKPPEEVKTFDINQSNVRFPPASGQPIVYLNGTKEENLIEADPLPIVPLAPRSPSPDFDLPFGWEVAIDATTGRKYYKDHMNLTTHWNKPIPDQSPEEFNQRYD
jgi:hypothetical protein